MNKPQKPKPLVEVFGYTPSKPDKIPPEAMAAAEELLRYVFPKFRALGAPIQSAGWAQRNELEQEFRHASKGWARIIAKHHAPLREALAECVSAFAQLTNRGGKRGQLACRMGDKCSAALGEG